MKGRSPWLWLSVALTLPLAGCGLFNPATPPPPSGSVGVHLPSLQSPDSALYSIFHGIEIKNSQLYMNAVAPDSMSPSDYEFHAFFDPQDLIEFTTQTGAPAPLDWRYNDEQTFFGQFTKLAPTATYTVALTPDANRADVLGAQLTVYYRHYRVSYGPNAFSAVGLADLYFRRVGVNQDWKLTEWVDRRDTTASNVRSYGRQRLQPGL